MSYPIKIHEQTCMRGSASRGIQQMSTEQKGVYPGTYTQGQLLCGDRGEEEYHYKDEAKGEYHDRGEDESGVEEESDALGKYGHDQYHSQSSKRRRLNPSNIADRIDQKTSLAFSNQSYTSAASSSHNGLTLVTIDGKDYYKNSKEEWLCTRAPCPKTFASRASVERHVRGKHNGIGKRFGCPTCDRTFCEPRFVLRHQKTTSAKAVKCHAAWKASLVKGSSGYVASPKDTTIVTLIPRPTLMAIPHLNPSGGALVETPLAQHDPTNHKGYFRSNDQFFYDRSFILLPQMQTASRRSPIHHTSQELQFRYTSIPSPSQGLGSQMRGQVVTPKSFSQQQNHVSNIPYAGEPAIRLAAHFNVSDPISRRQPGPVALPLPTRVPTPHELENEPCYKDGFENSASAEVFATPAVSQSCLSPPLPSLKQHFDTVGVVYEHQTPEREKSRNGSKSAGRQLPSQTSLRPIASHPALKVNGIIQYRISDPLFWFELAQSFWKAGGFHQGQGQIDKTDAENVEHGRPFIPQDRSYLFDFNQPVDYDFDYRLPAATVPQFSNITPSTTVSLSYGPPPSAAEPVNLPTKKALLTLAPFSASVAMILV
ncbi:hypothetical protein BKA65DRAFT_600784 [Rhexocercosporidium sp. MPI-PUGE-AT-0058]|nr:hypothetical protein BKA65DRAFT_600784 [Rhexocercosporidium sp. MPI-PUGE-AT-0058]